MPSISTSSPLIAIVVLLVIVALLLGAVLVAAIAQLIVNKIRGQQGTRGTVPICHTVPYPRF